MPANFPGNANVSDTFAFRAAVEAVIGVTLEGDHPAEPSGRNGPSIMRSAK